LFESDAEDEPQKKVSKPLSKRERMEALRAKKRQDTASSAPPESSSKKRGAEKSGDKKEAGYESEDSYNSAEYVRTKEDFDFIDTEGDDQDAINELYAEQTFDDAEAEEDGYSSKKKKIKGAGSSRERSERQDLEAEADDDNPIMMAVNKMKRKKKVQKKLSDLQDEAKEFLTKMQQAAEEDEEAFQQRRPALKKLSMLTEVCDMLARRDMTRPLLELDLLVLCKRWIQPLPGGKLGNMTVRQRILQSIALMSSEGGITSNDLKASEFGKVIMSLYMHKDETPTLKRQMKSLIEQWSRPIFQKSGNMRDLKEFQESRGGTGLAAIARINQIEQAKHDVSKVAVASAHRGGKGQDLDSLIKKGSIGKSESGINRVRVPFSKGFQFTVRPEQRTSGAFDKRRQPGNAKDGRATLSKRMLEKGRSVNKNQRSANVSVEGRVVK
jgi:transcription factor SPN1